MESLTLGRLVKIYKGRKAPEVHRMPLDGTLRYIQIGDVRYESEPQYANDPTGVIAEPSDVLIVWDGANAGTTGFGLSGFAGSTIAILRPNLQQVDTAYLGYYLHSKFDYLNRNTTGATIPHVSRHVLEGLIVPLPPLDEQRRIAAILERADRVRRLCRYALALGEGYLQAVFLEMFGDLTENPLGWKSYRLDKLAEIVSGVTKGQRFKEDDEIVELPYLRVANVQDGYLDLSEIKTIQARRREAESLILKPGDIVMTEGGDYDKLGRGAIWKGQIENCIHQNHIFRVRLNREYVLPQYFSKFLLTQFAKLYFLQASKQTTNLASINMTQLRALPVHVPPMNLQGQFVMVVHQYERIRAQQQEQLRQAEHLFASLLDRAFRGEVYALK